MANKYFAHRLEVVFDTPDAGHYIMRTEAGVAAVLWWDRLGVTITKLGWKTWVARGYPLSWFLGNHTLGSLIPVMIPQRVFCPRAAVEEAQEIILGMRRARTIDHRTARSSWLVCRLVLAEESLDRAERTMLHLWVDLLGLPEGKMPAYDFSREEGLEIMEIHEAFRELYHPNWPDAKGVRVGL